MQAELLKYFEDILFCIARIEYHVRDVQSFDAFKQSWTVYDAVERRLAIIGEAAWKIDKLDKDVSITEKKKIIGLRHILTHEYHIVSPDIIWQIIQKNIPLLKTEVQACMAINNGPDTETEINN